MQLIKGREIADNILVDIKSKIAEMETKPTLAVFLIGEDEASKIYVGLKEKAARDIGMNCVLFKYDSDASEAEILNKIEEANKSMDISGIIVQLPLPEGLDKNKITNAIIPQKDVDGFHSENQRLFLDDKECVYPVFPKAIMKMVEAAVENNSLENIKKASVVCMSDDFGLIMQEAFRKVQIEASYFFCDDIDKKENANILKESDVIITACGKINLINNEMVKEGVVIIDGGISKVNGKVVGDANMQSFEKSEIPAFISPVPSGVGPVTVACLLENTYLASDK